MEKSFGMSTGIGCVVNKNDVLLKTIADVNGVLRKVSIIAHYLVWRKRKPGYHVVSDFNRLVLLTVNALFVVTLVTYIMFPICTRLAAFWLFPEAKYTDKLRELAPKFLQNKSRQRVFLIKMILLALTTVRFITTSS
jgi:hypothetical protein